MKGNLTAGTSCQACLQKHGNYYHKYFVPLPILNGGVFMFFKLEPVVLVAAVRAGCPLESIREFIQPSGWYSHRRLHGRFGLQTSVKLQIFGSRQHVFIWIRVVYWSSVRVQRSFVIKSIEIFFKTKTENSYTLFDVVVF